jgi:hypothetical protein
MGTKNTLLVPKLWCFSEFPVVIGSSVDPGLQHCLKECTDML